MTEEKVGMHNVIIVPGVLHGSEIWEMNAGIVKEGGCF